MVTETLGAGGAGRHLVEQLPLRAGVPPLGPAQRLDIERHRAHGLIEPVGEGGKLALHLGPEPGA